MTVQSTFEADNDFLLNRHRLLNQQILQNQQVLSSQDADVVAFSAPQHALAGKRGFFVFEFKLNNATSSGLLAYKNLAAAEDVLTVQLASEPLILRDLDLLRAGLVEDERVPTDYAYGSAKAIVKDTLEKRPKRGLAAISPLPWATTDHSGAIRIRWNYGTKRLRAHFAAEPRSQSYIYFQDGADYGTEQLTSEALAARLDWLTKIL